MHELVQEVQQLVSHDPSHSVLFVLIIESATNIANSLPGALSDEE
jgi:coproporphyrinogen III oxidase-like Fe-S oxidoreductase